MNHITRIIFAILFICSSTIYSQDDNQRSFVESLTKAIAASSSLIMKHSPLLIVLFLFTHLTAFAEDSAFISNPGIYSRFGKALQISVTEKNGQIFYHVGSKQFSGGNAPSEAISAQSNWFLLPVSKDQVWVYHGFGPLRLFTVRNHSVSFDQSDSSPALLATAPKSVLERMGY